MVKNWRPFLSTPLPEPKKLVKLDLACGQVKKEGFIGVDFVTAPGVDIVHDLFEFPWPFEDESVEEVHCSHFFEHIPGLLRPKWMDELYRVMIPGGKATIICPYYSSMRATQDYTHAWPPISEASFFYFNKGWREANKLTHGHYDMKCDFDFGANFSLHPYCNGRSTEFVQEAVLQKLNAASDIIVGLIKRPIPDKNPPPPGS